MHYSCGIRVYYHDQWGTLLYSELFRSIHAYEVFLEELKLQGLSVVASTFENPVAPLNQWAVETTAIFRQER